jgi:hypothetical protein
VVAVPCRFSVPSKIAEVAVIDAAGSVVSGSSGGTVVLNEMGKLTVVLDGLSRFVTDKQTAYSVFGVRPVTVSGESTSGSLVNDRPDEVSLPPAPVHSVGEAL